MPTLAAQSTPYFILFLVFHHLYTILALLNNIISFSNVVMSLTAAAAVLVW